MSIWAHRSLERIYLHFLFIHLQICATEGYIPMRGKKSQLQKFHCTKYKNSEEKIPLVS